MVVTKSSVKTKFSGLVIPLLLAAFLGCGYYLYWSKAAREIETRARAALGQAGASSVKVSGFPYRLTLDVSQLKLGNEASISFTSSSLSATASPFNPMLWVLEGALDPTLALKDGPARPLKAENLKASLRLSKDGLERFSLTFDGVKATGDGGWRVGKGLFHVMTGFENQTSLATVLDLKEIEIAQPLSGAGAILGQKLQHVFVSGPIDQRQALMRSTQAWRDAGGKLTIMAGEIIWGPVYFNNAKGEITLSQDDKWQGNLAGQGALKPEGIAVAALAGPIGLEFKDDRLSLNGLPGIDLSDAFR